MKREHTSITFHVSLFYRYQLRPTSSSGAAADDLISLSKEIPTALQILASIVEQETDGDVRADYLKCFFQAYYRLEKTDYLNQEE